MKKITIYLLFAPIFLLNCNKVTVNKTEDKRGKWSLSLQTIKKSCDGSTVLSQNTEVINIDFFSKDQLALSTPIQTDTLNWIMVKVNSVANPSGVMIKISGLNGFEFKKYFIMDTNKKQETWFWENSCFFSSALVEYNGLLTKVK